MWQYFIIGVGCYLKVVVFYCCVGDCQLYGYEGGLIGFFQGDILVLMLIGCDNMGVGF